MRWEVLLRGDALKALNVERGVWLEGVVEGRAVYRKRSGGGGYKTTGRQAHHLNEWPARAVCSHARAARDSIEYRSLSLFTHRRTTADSDRFRRRHGIGGRVTAANAAVSNISCSTDLSEDKTPIAYILQRSRLYACPASVCQRRYPSQGHAHAAKTYPSSRTR